MNPAREQIEYALTKGFFSVLKICPAALIYGVCRGFSFLFYLAVPRRRKITMHNLALAFPDQPFEQRKQTARAAYDNFGQLIAESAMILAGKIKRDDLSKMVDDQQLSKLLELEEKTNKGILILTGHLGNFELLGHFIGTHLKRQVHAVARKGTNQMVDDRIVTPMRESFGNHVIYKERALPHAARALRKGEHVGLLIDIKIKAREGTPVQFFDHETFAVKSSAYLKLKLDPMVLPMTMVRTAPRQYKLIVGDPIPWNDNGHTREEQIDELTQIHQTALEELIRAYPDQWFWMHDRWKRPELERTRRKNRRTRKVPTS